MRVLAVVDDLMFQSKLEAAAAQMQVSLTVAASAEAVTSALAASPHDLAMVDLNLNRSDVFAVISALRQQAPDIRIIAYCSHVQTELQERARQAGCLLVLPRSAFVQRLPEFLQ